MVRPLPAPPGPSARLREIEALLRDLGPEIRRGLPEPERVPPCPTGLPELDRLLGGGLPRGRMAEIAGPPGAGRTTLALSLLAQATRRGEAVALVDPGDAFDPLSARATGADLHRLLWIRAPRLDLALRSTERILEAGGFALVVLDLGGPLLPAHRGDRRKRGASTRILPPEAAWARLQRAASAGGSALVVVVPERLPGSRAAVALELEPGPVRFSPSPPWLEGREIRVLPARLRGPAAGSRARRPTVLRTAAPFPP